MVDTSSGHRPPSAPSTSRNANGNLESEGILIGGKTDNYLSSLKERLICCSLTELRTGAQVHRGLWAERGGTTINHDDVLCQGKSIFLLNSLYAFLRSHPNNNHNSTTAIRCASTLWFTRNLFRLINDLARILREREGASPWCRLRAPRGRLPRRRRRRHRVRQIPRRRCYRRRTRCPCAISPFHSSFQSTITYCILRHCLLLRLLICSSSTSILHRHVLSRPDRCVYLVFLYRLFLIKFLGLHLPVLWLVFVVFVFVVVFCCNNFCFRNKASFFCTPLGRTFLILEYLETHDS